MEKKVYAYQPLGLYDHMHSRFPWRIQGIVYHLLTFFLMLCSNFVPSRDPDHESNFQDSALVSQLRRSCTSYAAPLRLTAENFLILGAENHGRMHTTTACWRLHDRGITANWASHRHPALVHPSVRPSILPSIGVYDLFDAQDRASTNISRDFTDHGNVNSSGGCCRV